MDWLAVVMSVMGGALDVGIQVF